MFAKSDIEVPLIQYEDIFLQYNITSTKPYTLNMVMELGEKDLRDVFEENENKPMSLKRFFPIFRDCILGLTYIHNKCIGHRDIKPDNVMKVTDNCYKIADYGEGINLSFNSATFEQVQFQKGKFPIKGTPSYLDPLIYKD